MIYSNDTESGAMKSFTAQHFNLKTVLVDWTDCLSKNPFDYWLQQTLATSTGCHMISHFTNQYLRQIGLLVTKNLSSGSPDDIYNNNIVSTSSRVHQQAGPLSVATVQLCTERGLFSLMENVRWRAVTAAEACSAELQLTEAEVGRTR